MIKSSFYGAAAALALAAMAGMSPDSNAPIIIRSKKKVSVPPPNNPKAERKKMLKVRAMQDRKMLQKLNSRKKEEN